jgi:hypothetical protein
MALDQINQRFPWHNRFHLSQEALTFGALFCRRLLVITVGEAFRAAVTELLGAHEAHSHMHSQAYSRERWRGFPESS